MGLRFPLLAAAALLAAMDGAAAAAVPVLEGHWVNQTLVAAARRTRSVRAALPRSPLVTEIVFPPGASRAQLHNEVEVWEADTRVLSGGDVAIPRLAGAHGGAIVRPAASGRSFVLVFPRDGTRYVFVRQRVPLELSAFRTALNAALPAGRYHDLTQGPPSYTNEVNFVSDGQVLGLRYYERYEVCIAGDCASMAASDMMTLAGEGPAENFLFRFNGRVLTLYRAVNTADPDEKPVYVAGEEFLRLTRSLAQPRRPATR